jgi:hypothetical protein
LEKGVETKKLEVIVGNSDALYTYASGILLLAWVLLGQRGNTTDTASKPQGSSSLSKASNHSIDAISIVGAVSFCKKRIYAIT